MMDNSSFRSAGDPIDAATRRNGRESVIDQECFFEGTFRTPGNMRIEGAYEGAIECQGTLLIAESGQVNARIVAGNLIVAGQFSGEVQCQSRFELLKSGRVSGSVTAQSTVVHDGAFFQGEIRMGGREPAGAMNTSPLSQQQPSQPQPPAAAAGSTAAGRPAAAGTGRRRTAAETSQADATAEPEETAEEPNQPPTLNGRSQSAAARDIVPNRTAES